MKAWLAERFELTGRVVVITGGLGLLGKRHADAVAAAGGIPVLVDILPDEIALQERVRKEFGDAALYCRADITVLEEVQRLSDAILRRLGRIDVLINNAANNPRVESPADLLAGRFENLPLSRWSADIAVGLTGAFLCCQVFGGKMAEQRRGVILNVASDLAIIAPDQRLYRDPGLPEEQQPVKPVTYSVVKTALLGLTRYLATYWANRNVRVNAISPGGVYNGQPDEFVRKLSDLIPLGRMAAADEYQAAVVFLCSDASSYMTGSNLVIDGGRTCW